jgi:hypothetical protein
VARDVVVADDRGEEGGVCIQGKIKYKQVKLYRLHNRISLWKRFTL